MSACERQGPKEPAVPRLKAHCYDFRVSRTLQPGSKGTQKFLEEYRETLVCVRYRDDQERGLRFTTIEHIHAVGRIPRHARPIGLEEIISIKTRPHEATLAKRLKTWGGTWDAVRGCWLVPYKVARKLRVARRAQLPSAAT